MTQNLRVERDGDVVVMTIHRESKRNALDADLWKGLLAALGGLAAAPPRALILTGAGDHFSSGMDLSPQNPLFAELMPAIAERREEALAEVIRGLKAVPGALAQLGCPTIAAIEGVCAGGGLELALGCDFRVASRDARFSLPETRVGLMPDVGGTIRTLRLLGRARAAELLITGRVLSGAEAEAWGLVTRVTEPKGALAAARGLAAEIIERAPKATQEVLALLRSSQGLDDATAFAAETQAGIRVLLAGEFVEGATAFMEKRAPKWA